LALGDCLKSILVHKQTLLTWDNIEGNKKSSASSIGRCIQVPDMQLHKRRNIKLKYKENSQDSRCKFSNYVSLSPFQKL